MLQPPDLIVETSAATAYDAVAYPTAIFGQSAPDRLATLARLHGLTPAPIETARVLEIAVGDGMNLIALGQAWPRATFHGFDLAASAIERGRDWIARAGLANVRLDVMDILNAGEQIDGEFDYIIAHGIYAWVPAPVRAAIMPLIGAKLAANGVALVSYNALPGCYIRMALRDALMFGLREVDGVEPRIAAARRILQLIADPEIGPQTAFQDALRHAARMTLKQPPHVMYHDELGECYHPQALFDVCEDATASGLRFLGDSSYEMMEQGFLPDGAEADDPEGLIVRLRQAEDYRFSRFFRHTTFVRHEVTPSRTLDQTAMANLYADTRATQVDAITFRNKDVEFEVADQTLAEALSRLVAAWPARVRVGDLVAGEAQREALFEMFNAGHIGLHTAPAPHAVGIGATPSVSPLARVMAAEEATQICTLDHMLVSFDAEIRRLLPQLDGRLSGAALLDAARGCGLTTQHAMDSALDQLARAAMLMPDSTADAT